MFPRRNWRPRGCSRSEGIPKLRATPWSAQCNGLGSAVCAVPAYGRRALVPRWSISGCRGADAWGKGRERSRPKNRRASVAVPESAAAVDAGAGNALSTCWGWTSGERRIRGDSTDRKEGSTARLRGSKDSGAAPLVGVESGRGESGSGANALPDGFRDGGIRQGRRRCSRRRRSTRRGGSGHPLPPVPGTAAPAPRLGSASASPV